MTDILERLKATTKINGAYPKDIADAIIELEVCRKFKDFCIKYEIDIDLEYEDTDEL